MRILLGIIIILDLLVRSTDMIAHYSQHSIIPPESMVELGGGYFISLHFISTTILFQRILFSISLLFAFLFTLGFHTKISNIISWLLLLSIHNRNVLLLNSGDELLRLIIFWAIFIPLGSEFSIDKYLSNKRNKNKKQITSIGTMVIKIQLCWMYLETYLVKSGDNWKAGFGTYYALSDVEFTKEFGYLVLEYSPISLLTLLSHFTLFLEILLPFLIIFPIVPIWRGSEKLSKISEAVQILGALVVLALHTGFGMCMEIGFFPFIPVAVVVGFLPALFWDILGAFYQKLVPESPSRAFVPQRLFAMVGCCVFECLSCCGLANQRKCRILGILLLSACIFIVSACFFFLYFPPLLYHYLIASALLLSSAFYLFPDLLERIITKSLLFIVSSFPLQVHFFFPFCMHSKFNQQNPGCEKPDQTFVLAESKAGSFINAVYLFDTVPASSLHQSQGSRVELCSLDCSHT